MIDDLRDEIDRIDNDILALLDRRTAIALQIGAEKAGLGLPVRNPAREAEVLAALAARRTETIPGKSVESIYRTIMAESVSLQEKARGDGGLRAECRANASGKRDLPVPVLENRELAPGFFRMRLALANADRVFSPGQFFQLAVRTKTTAPFLRRPFAPSEFAPGDFAFVYAVVGAGTRLMTELRPGDEVGLLAPLGKGYALSAPGSRAVLAGGGCGGPSLGPLAAALRLNGVEVVSVLGARTAARLVGGDALEPHSGRLVSCTDDGSSGFAGTAADALRAEIARGRVDAVYACGPVPMLRAVALIAAGENIPCQVSLEERMACGFGACVGCAVELRLPDGAGTKYGRVCHDGPVFDAARMAW